MAGLKLVVCLALISPTLSQVYNGQHFQQRQPSFGMGHFGMGGMAAMGGIGDYMDTRSDMIADAIERRGSMAQSVFRNQGVGFGSAQRQNGMNRNAQFNVYQAPQVQAQAQQQYQYQRPQVQARAQPYQLVNAVPNNAVYIQTVPSSQYVSASQMAASPQIIRVPQVIRGQQLVGAPQIMGSQQIIGAPRMVSAPQMVSARQTGATQQIAAAQQPIRAPQAPQPQANTAGQPQSRPSVTTQTAGNIPANKVIEMLKQMFTSTGNNKGVRKFVIV